MKFIFTLIVGIILLVTTSHAVVIKDIKVNDNNIKSKDILSEKDINSNKDLQNFQFINSLYDALELIKNKKYDGPKVIFGSHYIAKHVYNYFDFSFDKGNI